MIIILINFLLPQPTTTVKRYLYKFRLEVNCISGGDIISSIVRLDPLVRPVVIPQSMLNAAIIPLSISSLFHQQQQQQLRSLI